MCAWSLLRHAGCGRLSFSAEETLQALWRSGWPKRVKTTQRPLDGADKDAYERKIIHLVLQDDPEVYTRSEGEDADRRGNSLS